MTNIERIKNMDANELAEFLTELRNDPLYQIKWCYAKQFDYLWFGFRPFFV